MITRPTSILNPAGDYEELIERLSKHLGTEQIRRQVFNEIYGRIRKLRTKKEIMDAAGIPNKGNISQQVQNALEHLSRYHLIEKHKNEGQIKDGSHYIYGKADFVRANKHKIIKYADNKQAANTMPTKRRPATKKTDAIIQVSKRNLKKRKHLTVLYLTSSPDPDNPVRVDAEVRRVQEAIRASKYSENVTVHFRPAADLNSLIDGLNDHRPQIVHFSGHGNEDEILTDSGEVGKDSGKILTFDLLAKALAATDSPPEVIVLNSCKSSPAKKSLLPNANIIVTMTTSISDIAASAFAPRFYAAIAAGQSVKAAFEQGKVAVEAVSISEANTPELHCAPSVNPATTILT